MSRQFIVNASTLNERLEKNRVVKLKSGIYILDKSIHINSNNILKGKKNLSVKLVTNGADFPIIKCEGVKNVQIKNLVIEHCNMQNKVTSYGIFIHGEKIKIENVKIINASSGVYLKTHLTNYFNQDITLHQVSFKNDVDDNAMFPNGDSRQFGLEANSVKNLMVRDCHWSHAGLDGIKLRYQCLNVSIIGGSCNNNGLRYGAFDFSKCVQDPAERGDAGDGIDCFAGGENVIIDGTSFEKNRGNGITIKSKGGPLELMGDEYCGLIRNYRIQNVQTRNNMGYGIAIEGIRDSHALYDRDKLRSVLEDTRPRAKDILIKDCKFEQDHASGLFLNGSQITVFQCTVRESCLSGMIIGENASGIIIKNCQIISTGKIKNEAPNVYQRGLLIEEKSKGITVSDTLFNGENIISGKPPSHQFGIYIWEYELVPSRISADQVYIVDCISINNSDTLHHGPAYIGKDPTSGFIYIEHTGDLECPEGKVPAGVGSRYYSTRSNKHFIKARDHYEIRNLGWIEIS